MLNLLWLSILETIHSKGIFRRNGKTCNASIPLYSFGRRCCPRSLSRTN